MTRYEAILLKRKARQLDRIEKAASAVRAASRRHDIPVKFFGSYARGRVGPSSDLDVLILGDGVTDALLSDIEAIGAIHDVDIDIRMERDAPHLAVDMPS